MARPSREQALGIPAAVPSRVTTNAPGSDRRLRYAALMLGMIAALTALAVPLAPVNQDRVTLTWPAPGSAPAVTAAAIPLMPYQPVQLAATVSCAGAPANTVLLSTVPLRSASGAPLLPGLRVERAHGDLIVSSYGKQVASATQPAAPCALEVHSDPDRTSATLNGRLVGEVPGDVRPVVAGAFTAAPSTAGLGLTLITDTRFQTSMTPVKAALGALSVLALLGALLAVARLDARSDRTRRCPVAPPRWWRPRVIDAVVVAGLAMWAVIGPINIDDGYIASILRTRDTNGYIGNLHRWLNAPEAPFGWFYELYYLWSEISAAPLWMRIPSTALGVVCWLLLSRALLPRLGTFAARPATAWVAATVFAAWWLPFNLGLRPEPWIAVAGLLTLLAVERAVVTRRLLPVLLGLVVAAAATTITPTGIVTCTPFLAGLVPLLRALRQRSELTGLPLLVLLVAALSSALLLGFGDQTLASVAEATRVRTLIGGGLPWHQEIERYWNLLTPSSIEGSLQRRVPVLLTLLGLAGLAWSLGRHRVAGIARGPVTRVWLTLVLSLAVMIFTPTKWTYHFGALAGVSSAVLVTALHAWSRRALQVQQDSARTLGAAAVGTAALAVTAGAALAGFNRWHYVSNYGVPWSTLTPQLGGVSISTIVLAGGMLLAAGAGGTAAWALAGGGLPASIRLLPSPGLLALVLVVGTVSLQFGTFARAGVGIRGGYPMAADSIAAGSSCGLADHLRVETDPLAGLLAASKADGAAMEGFVPISEATVGGSRLEMAGAALPGWVALTRVGDPSRGNTPWYHLDGPARPGGEPVVVTISGELGPGSTLAAEFGRSGGAMDSATVGSATVDSATVVPLATVPLTDQPGAPAARDIRITVPDVPGANLVRLSVTANWDSATIPLAFSQPRSPRTKPMNAVVPPGTEAVVDWPVAFLYPCLEIAGTPGGAASVPRWRVSTPSGDDSGDIITAPHKGGPFGTPRALVRVDQLPVYLDGDPLLDVATLYRWRPVPVLGTPGFSRDSEVVAGWWRHGHLHVPGADQ